MKGFLFTIFAVVLFAGLSAQTVLTCADIQSNVDATGGSIYNGQVVTVHGIVTHKIPNSAFYIGDQGGGPWSGLYVYHGNTSNQVTLGDDVKLTGTLTEYYGLTELTLVTSYEILSTGNSLPPALELTTAEIPYGSANSEQYEGVLVRLTDVQIKTIPDGFGQFKVADASNVQAMVDNGLYAIPAASIVVNDWWFMIQGIVDFHSSSSAGFKINPRNSSDMIKQDSIENSIITIENTNAVLNQINPVNVLTTKVKLEWGVQSYTMKFKIDPSVVLFEGFDIVGTLTPETPVPTISAAGDTITFTMVYQGGLINPQDNAVLIKLLLKPLSYGTALIDLVSFKYENTFLNSLVDGMLITKIEKKIAYLSIGKTGDKKNIFNPYMNEKINITYGVKTGYLAKAVVRIYDAQGRLVYTPVHTNITSATGIENFAWDGRDSSMKLLPVGLYYCHLEVSDRSTGDMERTVQPIVIKSTLK